MGTGFLAQAEYCHYHVDSRSYCGPHAQLLLDNINISAGNGEDFCKCGYQDGLHICLPCKLLIHLKLWQNSMELYLILPNTLANMTSGVNPATAMNRISLTILSLFMIEVGKIETVDGRMHACKCSVIDLLHLHLTHNAYMCNASMLAYSKVLYVQVALKIFASGLVFFAHKLEVFDATIVALSWIIDIASE